MIFLGLKLGQKIFLGVCEKHGDTAQINNKCNLLLAWVFFWYAEKNGDFFEVRKF